jgi:hypothetical protein
VRITSKSAELCLALRHRGEHHVQRVPFCRIGVKFLGTSEGRQGKREQGKEPNRRHESPFAWIRHDVADFACGGSTPHISASLKFDTIQAMVRQFGQAVDFLELGQGFGSICSGRRLQEKVEC